MSTTDIKEAALLTILNRLEEIDGSVSSRQAFIGSHAFNMMHQLDQPIFEHEIELIRATLGIEKVKEQYEQPEPNIKPKSITLEDL